MPTVLITGSNRGLGLEFVRQYAGAGWQVIAATRQPADAGALAALAATLPGRVRIVPLDVTLDPSFDALAGQLRDEALDLVISNAGVMSRRGFGGSSWPDWQAHFRINSYAPLRLAESLLGAIERGQQKKFVTLTSLLGSVGANQSGGLYAYRASKAAANAVIKSLSIDLAARGVIALALHPGWVKTDLGGPLAPLDVQTSVTGMRNVIDAATPSDSGQFLQWDGVRLAW